MNITVYPSELNGVINAIASKSCIHRQLICAAIAPEPTVIEIKGSMTTSRLSDDIKATANCLQSLGAQISYPKENEILIVPINKVPQNPILNCKESGSTLRFMLPVAAALLSDNNSITFIGEGRLPNRPLSDLCTTLSNAGIVFSSNSLPLTISGTLNNGTFSIPGNISSQYITGLLLGLSILNSNSEIELTSNLESAAYVDITIDVLKTFGINISKSNNKFSLLGEEKIISPKKVAADGDWSNGAFFLALPYLSHNITVTGLDISSPQGDKASKELLSKKLSSTNNGLINVSETPDLLPILATCAMFDNAPITFSGGARLRLKESDRISSVAEMITNIGGKVQELEDGLIVYPQLPTGGTVNSYNDHRIVMSAAIAATKSKNPITIKGAEAVNKSYPTFFDDLKSLGGKIHVE